MTDIIWGRKDLQILRKGDGPYQYAVYCDDHMSSWVENPQELASYARSCLPEDGPHRADVTMFLKQERYRRV